MYRDFRASAAKIIEVVGEKKADWIAPYAGHLLSALDNPEPQTRWSCLYSLGLCAAYNPLPANQGFNKALQFLFEDKGTCLLGRAIDYLGLIGAVSPEYGVKSVNALNLALGKMPELSKRIFEAMQRMKNSKYEATRQLVSEIAEEYKEDSRSSVRKAAFLLLKK